MTATDHLYEILEAGYDRFNQPGFIPLDPISIPHRFSKKEDIEIAGFLTATLSWGNRRSILNSASRLLDLMENAPHDFVMQAGDRERARVIRFYHRTFNGDDALFFLSALTGIYREYGGLEPLFSVAAERGMKEAIAHFRRCFLAGEHLARSEKHLPDPEKGSAAKRLNMFLRWMVRDDGRGVDFGLWKSIPAAVLLCPLDVHSGRVARSLGLLSRRQNDWKAVEELTGNLARFDPADPVKYDFALFGSGITPPLRCGEGVGG
ncbi:MAG TPA: TIGR02757 family protein [Bacteroidales bacterium]|nr:TIGR02757 family protein [Bacteroidales bacterium]HPS62959.1 TIGR02757 family protein [Bacteroidales bacterium]